MPRVSSRPTTNTEPAISANLLRYMVAVLIQAAVIDLVDNWDHGSAWVLTIILILIITMTGGYTMPLAASRLIGLLRLRTR